MANPVCVTDDKVTMSWENWRGHRVTREVNQLIDVRDFIGTPGYSLLIVAANTNLSVAEIDRFLEYQSQEIPCVGRSLSWTQRHRWMFQQPGTDNTKGPQADADGNGVRARKIMAENPKLSVRKLSVVLRKEYGIRRSPEWVRKHRCDRLIDNLITHTEVEDTDPHPHSPKPPSPRADSLEVVSTG